MNTNPRFVWSVAVMSIWASLAVARAAESASPLTNHDSAEIADDPLLDDIQRAAVLFFWEQGHPQTGLVADRAPADGSGQFEVASIAATGFGLTAMCIAEERGYLEDGQAYERVLNTLRFLWEKMPHERGWYYHFVHHETGQRVWNCELSSIDTALLLSGVLTVRQYYADTEAAELATKIYERVDFPWMLNDRGVFSMGWSPERGFLHATWDGYSEHLALQIMALGSPTHPVPPETWRVWAREPAIIYDGMTFLGCPPMFTHQFSHAFLDLRGLRDDVADYWHNSVLATRAHYRMCTEELSRRYPHYSPQLWGITASDFVGGYTAWGGPPATDNIDGTVVPCGPIGGIVFMPDEVMETLSYIRDTYGQRAWKRYGFVDAFNPQTGWYASDVIGIDKGIGVVMVENLRSGGPWKWFMANPEIRKGMDAAGFRPLAPDEGGDDRMSSLFGAEAVPAEVVAGGWRGEPMAKVRRMAVGWEDADWQSIASANPLAEPDGGGEPSARFAALWTEDALHLRVRVQEEPKPDNDANGNTSNQDSFVEVYLDPGESVADHVDYRFRFTPPKTNGEVMRRQNGYTTKIIRDQAGYELEVTLPWATLGLTPEPALLTRGSLSVLEGTVSGPAVIKRNWRRRASGRSIELGWLVLME